MQQLLSFISILTLFYLATKTDPSIILIILIIATAICWGLFYYICCPAWFTTIKNISFMNYIIRVGTFLWMLLVFLYMLYHTSPIVAAASAWVWFRHVLFPVFWNTKQNSLPANNQIDLPPLSKEQAEIYEESELTDDEIHFFRTQLQKAKQSILIIEQGIATSSKLQVIEGRYNGLATIKDYFKALASQPKRLAEAPRYLYTYVPSLQEAIVQYNTINAHQQKTSVTYRTLETISQSIEQLFSQINEDYLVFMEQDLTDATVEVTYTTQQTDKQEINTEFEDF